MIINISIQLNSNGSPILLAPFVVPPVSSALCDRRRHADIDTYISQVEITARNRDPFPSIRSPSNSRNNGHYFLLPWRCCLSTIHQNPNRGRGANTTGQGRGIQLPLDHCHRTRFRRISRKYLSLIADSPTCYHGELGLYLFLLLMHTSPNPHAEFYLYRPT